MNKIKFYEPKSSRQDEEFKFNVPENWKTSDYKPVSKSTKIKNKVISLDWIQWFMILATLFNLGSGIYTLNSKKESEKSVETPVVEQWKDCCPIVDGIKLNVPYKDKGKLNPFQKFGLRKYTPLEIKQGFVKYYDEVFALSSEHGIDCKGHLYTSYQSTTIEKFLEEKELWN